ncbi:MAG: hypothetical protein ABSD31_13405 [Candidatus Binataceae bacterium]
MEILRRDADRKILDPLRTHKWNVTIEREIPDGMIIAAERGGHQHKVALIYTSATDNAIYKALATQVEHIFFNGQPYKVEAYTHGVDKPVSSADDFHSVLVEWNRISVDGKFVPESDETPAIEANALKHRLLLSEEPIEAIWLRIRQLQSVMLAKKLIERRALADGVQLDEAVIQSKAEGVAYALRNASDYFQAKEGRNVSQRILNLYYGSLAFASAEMLAAPNGAKTLAEIEDSTKVGHGLYTIDGLGNGLEQIAVGVFAGFFPAWTASMGSPIGAIPPKKARRFEDLASYSPASWVSVETLFASIPEVADLFSDIFEAKPSWVRPVYDKAANAGITLFGGRTPATRSYLQLVDDTGRLTKEDIALFAGPISEITEVASQSPGRHFRVAVDHPGKRVHWEALRIHQSPFERQALIRPIFGVIDEYRAISVVLLYAFSIIVRYRPSIWRRVQEGDLDHMRVLIEAFLAVVERVLPEQFLEKVTGQRVFAKQPGSFF